MLVGSIHNEHFDMEIFSVFFFVPKSVTHILYVYCQKTVTTNYSSHDIVALETNPFYMYLKYFRNHSGRDCMVVGFTTTCVISDYHHESFESEPRSIQHYVIKFVSDLRQIGGFLLALLFPPPIKLTVMI
jgi:hypothetical protein